MDKDGRVIMESGYRFSFRDGVAQEVLDQPANIDFVYFGMSAVTSIADKIHRVTKKSIAAVRAEAREQVARLELENAEQRAIIAELRAKQSEHEFIISRLRIENAGPIGPQGLMGRDGAEGRPGVRGERGEQGEGGLPAREIASWEPRDFQIVPVFTDGTRGVPINLRPAFEQYDASGDDDDG
jgi:hypothetical protein